MKFAARYSIRTVLFRVVLVERTGKQLFGNRWVSRWFFVSFGTLSVVIVVIIFVLTIRRWSTIRGAFVV